MKVRRPDLRHERIVAQPKFESEIRTKRNDLVKDDKVANGSRRDSRNKD